MKEIRLICRALREPARLPAVLATLVSVRGSSYRRPGARMLVSADGRRTGAISGGCLEEDIVARTRRVLETGCPELLAYDTSAENDLVWGVGLGCHGVVEVLLERLTDVPPWVLQLEENIRLRRATTLRTLWATEANHAIGTSLHESAHRVPADACSFVETLSAPIQLLVFGAGDDARPLARLAHELGWQILAADPRPVYATAVRFPEAQHARVIQPTAPLDAQGFTFDDHTVAVVMTHHYVHDLPLLRQLLPLNLPYLGLLGPKARAERILADLAAAGLDVTPEQQERLHAPVGLDLGATTPETVALSIIAEIQSVLAGRSGQPLRDRQKPIHG